MRAIIVASLLLAACTATALTPSLGAQFSTSAATGSPFTHYWKECVGSGHALLGTRADWQRQLISARNELGFKQVRMHGIFDDDMSVVLQEGTNATTYQFYNVDQVYDFLLSIDMRPIVELSFMPGLLAQCAPWVPTAPACQTVMHYEGVVQPPARFADWEELVYNFGMHLVERYGIQEVSAWHFEVWNELWGMPYPHPYLELYESSRRALKRVSPLLKVGGPATMQCQYVPEFVRDATGFEFVSTHLYPTDPNCTANPDIDCFAHTIQTARSQAPATKPFFITEYNAGLDDIWKLYSTYAAAFIFRNIPLLHNVVDVFSYWTFSDIFEENGMHSAPFDGYNYGIQVQQGDIKKPAYRAFELLRPAGSYIFPTATPAANESLSAFVTASQPDGSGSVSAFVSNFAPTGFAITTKTISVKIAANGTCPKVAQAFIIDPQTTDPHAAWVAMGSPSYPTRSQLETIKQASHPIVAAVNILPVSGGCSFQLELPPYSAARVDLQI